MSLATLVSGAGGARNALKAAQFLGSPSGRQTLKAIASAAPAVMEVAKRGAKQIQRVSKKLRTNFQSPKSGKVKTLTVRRYGTTTGKHAGFYRGYRRMGRTARRRYRQAIGGVQSTREVAVTVSDDRCVYIGHHSMPTLEIAKQVVYAMFKSLMNHAGIHFSSFDESRLGSIPDNSIIGIEYRLTPTAALAAASFTVTVGAVQTFREVADGFWLVFYNNFIIGANMTQWTNFYKFYFNTGAQNADQLMLQNAQIDILTKSALKMQNRSINTVDDDESGDVNNVPLIGRSYQFKGNLMTPNDSNASNSITGAMLPTNDVTGFIQYGAGSTNVLAEPPPPYYFTGSPKSLKIRLQPGQIKTSVVSEKKVMNFNVFWRAINAAYRGGITGNPYTTLGKSRLFALERTIARMTGEVQPGIVVATELDMKYWIKIRADKGKYSAPINIVL